MLTTQLSMSQCDCTDYAYVPDYGTNLIHKFDITSPSNWIEVGNPWAFQGQPHGIGFLPDGSVISSNFDDHTVDVFSCTGSQTDPNVLTGVRFRNVVTIGNIMYTATVGDNCNIRAYDMCNNFSQIGKVALNSFDCTDDRNWGIALGPDGMIYVTDNYLGGNGAGNVFVLDPDISNFTSPTTVTVSALISGMDQLKGIDVDANGNIYVLEQSSGSDATTILKFDNNGNYLCAVTDAFDNSIGFYNGWGIVLSPDDNLLYITSWNEDCVAAISTSCPMSYQGAAVPHEPGTAAKGIRITTECCPQQSEYNIELCADAVGQSYNIRDILNCDGPVCEGSSWSAGGGNTGLAYDDCEQTITITDMDACGTFTSSSNGTNSKSQCAPFSITISICVETPEAPVISVSNNVCPATTGSFNVVTPCTTGYTTEWSTNGGVTWSATAPTWADGVSAVARCVNADGTCVSPVSNTVTAVLNDCCDPDNCVSISITRN